MQLSTHEDVLEVKYLLDLQVVQFVEFTQTEQKGIVKLQKIHWYRVEFAYVSGSVAQEARQVLLLDFKKLEFAHERHIVEF